MKKILREHPDANMILHPSWYVDGKGRRMGSWRCPLPAYPHRIDSDLMLGRLLVQNFISMPAPLFNRVTALKLGGLDENLWYTSDWDFWLKMSSCGKILYYPHPLSAFRLHAGSQTILRSANLPAFKEQQETVLDRHAENLKGHACLKERVRKTAAFSNEVNIAIASLVHQKNASVLRLLRLFFALGPPGWHRYFRDSRIFERVTARFRAGLLWDGGK
jgi:hypothetical protein